MFEGIKAENDVDVEREQDCTVAEMDGVHVPSTFSVQDAQPEVSCFEIVFALLLV